MCNNIGKADSLSCFGWAQDTQRHSIVGEVRCNKYAAAHFYEWFESNEQVKVRKLKTYENAKIRLHFSHFKILQKERQTCFSDEPHQCIDEIL